MTKLLFIAKFLYNNAQNISIDHTPFEFNYDYHFYISFEEDINLRSKLKLVDKLIIELQNLIIIYQDNLFYAQKFQKQAHDKNIKLRNYFSSKKV